jgi:hypothetical protein
MLLENHIDTDGNGCHFTKHSWMKSQANETVASSLFTGKHFTVKEIELFEIAHETVLANEEAQM